MKFVAVKTVDQLDLQALHRVRERLVSQRTGIINQIRAFLLERGDVGDLAGAWRRLDAWIDQLTQEIMAIAGANAHCLRTMSVPGVTGASARATASLDQPCARRARRKAAGRDEGNSADRTREMGMKKQVI